MFLVMVLKKLEWHRIIFTKTNREYTKDDEDVFAGIARFVKH